MERFLVALQQLQGYRVQEHSGQSVAAWIQAMQSRPSVQLAGPDPALLATAFRCASFSIFRTPADVRLWSAHCLCESSVALLARCWQNSATQQAARHVSARCAMC